MVGTALSGTPRSFAKNDALSCLTVSWGCKETAGQALVQEPAASPIMLGCLAVSTRVVEGRNGTH